MSTGGKAPWRAVAALLVLLAAPVLSGCLGTELKDSLEFFVYEPLPPKPEPIAENLTSSGLSARLENVTVGWLNLTIPSFDATPLALDLWRPEIDRPVPTILIVSPYFEDSKDPENNNTPRGGLYAQTLRYFAPRGYAVALADLRGTRLSGGCLDLGGPGEQGDAAALVEYLATQPWSNGKVGMIGGSYDGWTQQMAAVSKSPYLAAIVPIAPIADVYHGVGKGGAKFAGWTPGMSMGYSFNYGLGIPSPLQIVSNPTSVLGVNWAQFLTGHEGQHLPSQTCAVENQVWANDPSGDYNGWFTVRDLRERAKDATAAMFYTHGFYDINARPDHIDPWYAGYGGPKRAFLYQADHFMGTDAPGTGRTDWWEEVHRWFDFHLLAIPNGADATYNLVEVQDNLGRWRHETAWPPADATPVAFHLGDRTLSREPAAAGTAIFREDPFEDAGEIGTRSSRVMDGAGPARLVFASEPLAEAVHYAGRPVASVLVSSDKANTNVVARLYDIHPDGSWVLVNKGVHTIRHRDGLDKPSHGTPGTPYKVPVSMQPEDYVFRAGHAIGLAISASDASYVLPTGAMPQNTIHYGGAEGSALLLPAVERTDFTMRTWGSAQPTWLGPKPGEAFP